MSSQHAPTIPVAVFDISSSSVGGAHALIKKGAQVKHEKIIILAQSRIDAVTQEDLTIERFVSDTLKGIESVATTIRTLDAHQPEYIQVVLASPWYSSQTRSINYNKTTPFICTEKLLNELISKEIEYILTNEEKRFGKLGKEYFIIEKQLSLVKLNGYVTQAPYGKKVTSVELFLTITIVPTAIITQFTDLIRRLYGTRKIGFTTSPYTTFIATRDHTTQECVVLDIGEEITDVAFIKNDLFLYQHSFPMGTYELYRSVARATGNTLSEVKALLETYRLQKLTGLAKSSIDTAITSFIISWQKQLQTIIDNGHYGFSVPSRWYIVTDPRFEQSIRTAISTDSFLAHKASTAITPIIITEKHYPLIQQAPETVIDTPLALALLFIDQLV